MNRKRLVKSLLCAAAAPCGVAMTATGVSAQYVPVYGGPTYDQTTQTGYSGAGAVYVGNGVAVGSAQKYSGGTNLGERAVRWDASGSAVTELGNLGTGSTGYTESGANAVNTAGAAVGFARKYSGGTNLGERAV